MNDDNISKTSWAWRNLTGLDRDWTPTMRIRTVTASGNVNPLDSLIRVDATGGAVTLTLETAVGCDGRMHSFKLIDASANGMTADGNGSETIDGAATKSTTTQYASFTLVSNGVSWDVVT